MFKHELLVATTNKGKLSELRALLAGLDVDVRGLTEVFASPPVVEEDGDTFEANALKKAREVAQASGMLTLADDSGLEVDALEGRPGVRSARFAGEAATDDDNLEALLQALRDQTPGSDGHYAARFRCVLALWDPTVEGGEPVVVEGVCEGAIQQERRGHRGFGYDPVFVPRGGSLTLAELDAAEKNTLSHRAKAMARMRLVLEKVLAARSERVRRLLAAKGR